jgi:phosphoribosyl-ATP pyrophosphohydrolase
MTHAVKHSNLNYSEGDEFGPSESDRRVGSPDRTGAVPTQASASSPHATDSRVAPETLSRVAAPGVLQGELDRLFRALAEVTPENHPRTARLLASSSKTAQKVIEEAGEVAIEAVKRHSRGIVRESADLLYHLVALWHRAGIDPADVWIEMRSRADTLGIAEKLPKTRRHSRARHRRKPSPERNDP